MFQPNIHKSNTALAYFALKQNRVSGTTVYSVNVQNGRVTVIRS